jgi:hypothetical protein
MDSGPDFKKFIEIDVPVLVNKGCKGWAAAGFGRGASLRNKALNASSLSSERSSRLGDSDLVNDVADFNSAI